MTVANLIGKKLSMFVVGKTKKPQFFKNFFSTRNANVSFTQGCIEEANNRELSSWSQEATIDEDDNHLKDLQE